jgi:uncharacterized protein DUF3616
MLGAMNAKAVPHRQIALEFTPPVTPEGRKARRFRDSLSAVEVADDGRTLFLGVDETVNATPTIERLCFRDDRYAAHEPLALDSLITLPDSTAKKGRVGEIDIEGFAACDSFLWVVGSHSAARKKPKQRSIEEDFKRLARVELGNNRLLLARIPLIASAGGATLSEQDGERRSARLDDLRGVLCNDPLLGPFVGSFKAPNGKRLIIPGKDNGFDIEGLIVAPGAGGSNRVLLGLRGPVLRGWATIVEVAVAPGDKAHELVLGRLEGSKACYRKHLLHLQGLGIRDMRADGNDVLILAGPTMTLEGKVAIYRWIDGMLASTEDTLTDLEPGRLEHVLTLPHGHGEDHPEGFARLPSGEIIVVYDSPGEARCIGEDGVLADVFAVPAAG